MLAADRLKPVGVGRRDVGSLKSAVHEMCAEFGKVTRIEILTMSEAENGALCFRSSNPKRRKAG